VEINHEGYCTIQLESLYSTVAVAAGMMNLRLGGCLKCHITEAYNKSSTPSTMTLGPAMIPVDQTTDPIPLGALIIIFFFIYLLVILVTAQMDQVEDND